MRAHSNVEAISHTSKQLSDEGNIWSSTCEILVKARSSHMHVIRFEGNISHLNVIR